MLSRDQMPRNGRLKIGILIVLAAMVVGAAEIADNGAAALRGAVDWWRRPP